MSIERTKTWIKLISIPAFLAIWQLVSSLKIVNPLLFPPPTIVISSLWDYLFYGEGLTDTLWSLQRVAVGYVAGAVIGIGIGVLTGASSLLSGLLTPVFQVLRPIPPIAFVPIVIVWFGLTEFGKWFLVFWGVFFTVWLATHMGVQRVNPRLVRAAQSLGAKPSQLLWQIQFPAALPVIFVGLRTSISIAFYTLVAAEMAGAYAGIAYRLEITQQNLQIGHMMAGLMILGLLSALSDRLFYLFSRRVVHWTT